MRILVADGDSVCAQSIELMLLSKSFNVYTTDSGEEAIELGKLYDYDCVVLGDTPYLQRSGVIRQLRIAKVKTPILVLSEFAAVDDIVAALGVGADDYMKKPFHRDELVARIHSLVRRSKGHAMSVITTGDMVVNINTKTVEIAGERVHLTGKEYAMLELLSLRKGMTITKEGLLNHLYGGFDEPELKIIDVFICKIRKKLDAVTAGLGHAIVETVWGRGYVVRDPIAPKVKSPSLAPEVRDLMDEPPVYVSKRTAQEAEAYRARRRFGSPSIVPDAGQK